MSLPDAAREDADRLVVLAPIEPAATGNGLAMRAELFRNAAPPGLEVQTVVVPVAGRIAGAEPGRAVVVLPDVERAREGTIALASDRTWSDRLARTEPLPAPARLASPGLADEVARVIGGGRVAIHTVRAYMAPLAAAVCEQIDARWATLDLDEDDAAFARSLGDLATAAAYERLLAVYAPLFDGVAAASAGEAALIGERHRLAVEQLPNAVLVPGAPQPRLVRGRHEAPSLLYVGNLTYGPNIEAAERLVGEILPALRRRLGRPVRTTLVGPHDGRLDRLRAEDVEVTGFVDEVAPFYASASVVVVPLRSGAGTRIKLLEAFAHSVPVVASSVAAAGLDVVDGRHLLLADDRDRAVAAIEAVLSDEALAERLAEQAVRLVRERYSAAVVTPTIRDFYGRAAAGARARAAARWRG